MKRPYHTCHLTTHDGQKTFEGVGVTLEQARAKALTVAKRRSGAGELEDFVETSTFYGDAPPPSEST